MDQAAPSPIPQSTTLSSAPSSILAHLATEPIIPDDEEAPGPITTSLFDFLDPIIHLPDFILPSVRELVQAMRAGGVPIPAQALALLNQNTADFYSVIGAGSSAVVSVSVDVDVIAALHRECPSVWYVNIPHPSVSGGGGGGVVDEEAVRRSRAGVKDFRSWSSKKWWEEVARRYGGLPDDPLLQVLRSKQFAEIACQDMVKMSWLRTTRAPANVVYTYDCLPGDLHAQLVERVVENWTNVDRDLVEAVEPVFQGIIRALQQGSRESVRMKTIVMDKYAYEPSSRSVTSYIRLLSFEIHNSVYDLVRGKGGESQSRLRGDFSVLCYEAVFESDIWAQFSATLHDDEKIPLWDYVMGQTIEVLGMTRA
ncbi:hypothetical protein QBC47DRAFT_408232 [Echria macrotheca]|uniref:Uncharacterized protein n=1 Tax=Echria macrotheca TaxID=438768 RepID=A0AAJ0FGH3_9PEZI|nr:hypothetical protein QBC47DRAFT_408232 [Echria macrotheca]